MANRALIVCFLPLLLGVFIALPTASDNGQTERGRPKEGLRQQEGSRQNEGIGQKDSIVKIQDMNSGRSAHSMTVLPTGNVLIVGGMSDRRGELGTTELFNPITNQFGETGQLATPRHSHSATMFPDGRVLIAGGYDVEGRYLDTTEFYNPKTGRFTGGPRMQETRAGHKAVVLHDGRVLMIGGVGTGWTFLASAEIYDPVTNQFEKTGSMRVPRESHSAVLLTDGSVLVIGGHSGRRSNMRLYDLIERFDPDSQTFSEAGNLQIERHKQDAILLTNGTVLVAGGADTRDSHGVYDSVEIYDPATQTSSMTASMASGRYKHEGNSVMLSETLILFAGGASQAERYDLESENSEFVPGETNLAGQFSAASLLPDGRVLITGGYGGGTGPRPSAWMFTPGK